MDFLRYAMSDKAAQQQDLAEAGAIVDGRTKLIPERRHLYAMALQCQRLAKKAWATDEMDDTLETMRWRA